MSTSAVAMLVASGMLCTSHRRSRVISLGSLGFALLRPFLNGLLLGVLFGAVAGIMVYIAVEELIPSSRQYGHDRPALWATLCGICVMPLTHLYQT